MSNLSDHTDTAHHVAFAAALSRWLERAGLSDGEAVADLAVGMADVLNAAGRAAVELDALLALDPSEPAGADAALTRLGYLHALFLSEMTGHLDDLARRWESLEERLLLTAPNDESDEPDLPAR
jgi:hypothetical protein